MTQQPLINTVRAVDVSLERRAAIHAALGEPVRLAIVEDLSASDRAPSVLATRHGLRGNLLAHHLDVLERVGLIERHVSSGDRRRRYVRLRHEALRDVAVIGRARAGRALFVCTHNSARSQLAAALWRERTGAPADSAGTHPADRVHPGAVRAARRAGLDIQGARPRALRREDTRVDVVVTVCDRAHEELDASPEWLHWSIPDPVEAGTRPGVRRHPGRAGRAHRRHLLDLEARADLEGTAMTDKPAVLFLCVHNAGRSQMAAGWLRDLAGDAVGVYSGGSDPGAGTNPAAVAAMAEVGIDISGEQPRAWTDDDVGAADVVVTMGCGDTCPVLAGKRYEDWELTDPAGQPVEVVRSVRDDIERRVRDLVARLGVPAQA